MLMPYGMGAPAPSSGKGRGGGLMDILGMGGMGGGESNPALGLILGGLAGIGAATDKRGVAPGSGAQNLMMLPFMMQLLKNGQRKVTPDATGVYPNYNTDLGR